VRGGESHGGAYVVRSDSTGIPGFSPWDPVGPRSPAPSPRSGTVNDRWGGREYGVEEASPTPGQANDQEL
jgi:hypothetical protein